MLSEATRHMIAVTQQCDALDQQFRQALARREKLVDEAYCRQVSRRREGLEKERLRLKRTREALTFFQFQEKRELDEEITRLEKCIAEYSGAGALQQARMEFARKIEKATGQYRAVLDGYLARRFPYEALRIQAQTEFDSWYQGSYSQQKDWIYAALAEAPGQTLEQIAQRDGPLKACSQRRIAHLLQEMEAQGQLAISMEGNAARYRTAGPRPPKSPQFPHVDFSYEAPEVAGEPIPQPPRVEDVL